MCWYTHANSETYCTTTGANIAAQCFTEFSLSLLKKHLKYTTTVSTSMWLCLSAVTFSFFSVLGFPLLLLLLRFINFFFRLRGRYLFFLWSYSSWQFTEDTLGQFQSNWIYWPSRGSLWCNNFFFLNSPNSCKEKFLLRLEYY